MSGFDRNQVYVVPVHPAANVDDNIDRPSETLEHLKQFLMNFRVGQSFIYRSVLSPRFLALSMQFININNPLQRSPTIKSSPEALSIGCGLARCLAIQSTIGFHDPKQTY